MAQRKSSIQNAVPIVEELMKLPPKELSELCKPKSIYAAICQNETFMAEYLSRWAPSDPADVLSDEMLLEILLVATPDEIKNLCATNKRYAELCKDEGFRRDYSKKWGVTTPRERLEKRLKQIVDGSWLFGDILSASKNDYLEIVQYPGALSKIDALRNLNFQNVGMETIPKEIFDMTRLVKLEISQNRVSEIPSEIGRLTKLTHLDLQSNQIVLLPPDIGNLYNLKIMAVNNNLLSSLPNDIGRLIQLSHLYINDNHLTSLPAEIGDMRSLELVDAQNNRLETIPKELGKLGATLASLDVEHNPIKRMPLAIKKLILLGYKWHKKYDPLIAGQNEDEEGCCVC